MSMKQQGDLIFEILDKKPAFWAAPISLFDAIIGGLAFFGKWFDGAEDAAELARIGTYCTYVISIFIPVLPLNLRRLIYTNLMKFSGNFYQLIDSIIM